MTFRLTLTLLSLLLSSLTLFATEPVLRLPEVQADPVQYTLWGHTFLGWGVNQMDLDGPPGPTLEALAGETVQLSLYSADAPTGHTFGVDWNGNGFLDGTEEESPFFSSNTMAFTWSFTANSTHPGTYTYWCGFHLGNMDGTFIVNPTHDVSVIGMAASRNFAYSGVPSNPITVSVTVANQGQASETFSVTARASTFTIGTQTVSNLATGTSTTVTFSWAANLLPRGTYTLSADVPQLSGETDLADNTLTAGVFTVRLGGDINNDCTVNILDLVTAGTAFGSTPTSGNWNPATDLNNDNTVNILDLVLVGTNFAQSCPP